MIQYYISYKQNETELYLTGITFYNEAKWDTDITKVKLYNEYPAPFILNSIIKQTKIDNTIITEMNKENLFIYKIKITDHSVINTINLKDKWI